MKKLLQSLLRKKLNVQHPLHAVLITTEIVSYFARSATSSFLADFAMIVPNLTLLQSRRRKDTNLTDTQFARSNANPATSCKVYQLLVFTSVQVQEKCTNCGVAFGKYYCSICKLFDNNTTKGQFHCDGCGICRQGGKENFFHCTICCCCLPITLKEEHKCIPNLLQSECPVCLEDMMHSTQESVILPKCSHALHKKCFMELSKFNYQCPLCFKSFADMSHAYTQLEAEIASNPMPEDYQNKSVTILCNDCNEYFEFICVNFIGRARSTSISQEQSVLYANHITRALSNDCVYTQQIIKSKVVLNKHTRWDSQCVAIMTRGIKMQIQTFYTSQLPKHLDNLMRPRKNLLRSQREKKILTQAMKWRQGYRMTQVNGSQEKTSVCHLRYQQIWKRAPNWYQ
eukprot:TRINITY_DN135130_c1_g1_i1.p1 TRINITY_DN135130_c1_g1~~TRINITY_DN135130_c1_g1_i1.p1  ORF type:complete len:432 (+),score=-13.07 TRINITY_DN135130_c1_g1_i1:100-1296(+)